MINPLAQLVPYVQHARRIVTNCGNLQTTRSVLTEKRNKLFSVVPFFFCIGVCGCVFNNRLEIPCMHGKTHGVFTSFLSIDSLTIIVRWILEKKTLQCILLFVFTLSYVN